MINNTVSVFRQNSLIKNGNFIKNSTSVSFKGYKTKALIRQRDLVGLTKKLCRKRNSGDNRKIKFIRDGIMNLISDSRVSDEKFKLAYEKIQHHVKEFDLYMKQLTAKLKRESSSGIGKIIREKERNHNLPLDIQEAFSQEYIRRFGK